MFANILIVAFLVWFLLPRTKLIKLNKDYTRFTLQASWTIFRLGKQELTFTEKEGYWHDELGGSVGPVRQELLKRIQRQHKFLKTKSSDLK